MRTTQDTLQKMRDDGEKIVILTCYDASFATLLEDAGVDILLVGDSLGNVLQGEETTLPVTLDDMIYHTRCVKKGSSKAFIMADMPFGTSQVTPEDTFENAAELMGGGLTRNSWGTGYKSFSSGANTTSTLWFCRRLQSSSNMRGYRSKSSAGKNCSRLTKMLATTKSAC